VGQQANIKLTTDMPTGSIHCLTRANCWQAGQRQHLPTRSAPAPFITLATRNGCLRAVTFSPGNMRCAHARRLSRTVARGMPTGHRLTTMQLLFSACGELPDRCRTFALDM